MNARFGAELPDVAANSSPVLCHEIAHLATRELHGHRCPVCQLFRAARRLMSRWRCAACVASGLEGRLSITRHER
ncbi:MAG TPA: hypothetical protein VJH87_22540 [Vicinamibacteria bacterium]|nr:hypothetical protein [Vicinamibacteria bacterium]